MMIATADIARNHRLFNPSLTTEVCIALVEGIAAEAAGCSIPDLVSQRDAALIAALVARREAPNV